VVREAIAQLRYDGLIEARQGVGAFVADPDQRRAFRIAPDCFAKRQALLKLLQLRASVSSDAAAFAASNRTPAQLRRLERCLADMQRSMRQGMEGAAARVDAEMRFYATIALASGNEYFAEFLAMLDNRILAELRSVAVKNAMAAEWGEQVLDEHRSVLAAIESGSADAARVAARAHYERAARRLADRADIADV
jgi:GntR family transcriptional repressor for pyruvate dehydrogenase complex